MKMPQPYPSYSNELNQLALFGDTQTIIFIVKALVWFIPCECLYQNRCASIMIEPAMPNLELCNFRIPGFFQPQPSHQATGKVGNVLMGNWTQLSQPKVAGKKGALAEKPCCDTVDGQNPAPALGGITWTD